LRSVYPANNDLPDAIFRLPKPQLALFLTILFSSHGSVYLTRNSIPALSYSTISLRLAQDVQHLLLRFGFITKLRTKRGRLHDKPYSAYEIQMLGVAEVKRYLEEIGIRGRESAKEAISHRPSPS